MKRLLIIMIMCSAVLMASCGQEMKTEYDSKSPSMFIVVENGGTYEIVYHAKTKVMYAISDGYYNSGNFTLLVDANGDPLIWKGALNERYD